MLVSSDNGKVSSSNDTGELSAAVSSLAIGKLLVCKFYDIIKITDSKVRQ